MDRATDIAQWVNLVLFVAVAVSCFQAARRHNRGPARWAAFTFGTLGSIVVLGQVLPEEDVSTWITKLLIIALIAYPFGLYNFAASFSLLKRRTDTFATAVTAALVVATLAVPSFPEPEEARPGWFGPYLVLFMVQWVGLSILAAHRLWRAGRGLPTVARYRMRTLAGGATGLALALLPGLIPAEDQPVALEVVTLVLPAFSALMFAIGFAPPRWLRTLWRRPDQAALRAVELELITATDRDRVFAAVLPHAAALVGGKTAAFRTDLVDSEYVDESTIRLPLADGHLVVEAGPHTPFFGHDEVEMLQSLTTFVDLVLERTDLLARERTARSTAERINSELETLVYGISHDLKSPVISLLGYVEYLRDDYGDKLDDSGRHFLDRMEKSAVYMQDLLSDLLELSRVGRASVEPSDVDLVTLVSDVRVDVAAKFPSAKVEVSELPVVSINPPRARQLFTNLIENAARHGGREDITIRVFGTLNDDGSADVSVADDGVGIPPEYREKAFGIFERLTSRDASAGTGIGLALCRKIVETAGGEISIVDAPVGTHVRITFPPGVVRDDHRQPAEVSP